MRLVGCKCRCINLYSERLCSQTQTVVVALCWTIQYMIIFLCILHLVYYENVNRRDASL